MFFPSPTWDPLSPAWRTVYIALLPSLVLLLLPPVFSLLPHLLPRSLKRVVVDVPYDYFGPHLTLAEIYPEDKEPKPDRPRKKTVVLVLGALLQLQGFFLNPAWKLDSSRDVTGWVVAALLATIWLYAAAYPLVVRRRLTPYTPLLIVYVFQLVTSSLTFFTSLYVHKINPSIPFLPTRTIVSEAVAIAVDLVLIGTTLSLKLVEVPQAFLDEQEKLLAKGELGGHPVRSIYSRVLPLTSLSVLHRLRPL